MIIIELMYLKIEGESGNIKTFQLNRFCKKHNKLRYRKNKCIYI